MNTQRFSQTGQMIERCCEYLSLQWIWLYDLVMSRTHIKSESALYFHLNVQELLARNRCDIWKLSYCYWTRSHSHLARKLTLNNLSKLANWYSCVVSTYLYGAFDCIFLSCHVLISEWICTVYFPECLWTPCSKQTWYLKLKWLQRDTNP